LKFTLAIVVGTLLCSRPVSSNPEQLSMVEKRIDYNFGGK